jgi:hypothetical protein
VWRRAAAGALGLLRLRRLRLSLHDRGLLALLLLVVAGGFLVHQVHGGCRGQHGGIVHGALLLVLMVVACGRFGLRRHNLTSASGRRRIVVVDVHGLDRLRRRDNHRRRCRLLLLLLLLLLFVHWLLLMLLRARPVARAALQLLVRLWLVLLVRRLLLVEGRTAE